MASEAQNRTYSVIQAGAMAGLGRNASYRAASTGQMPTIKLGRKLRVPALLWQSILDGQVAADTKQSAPANPLILQERTNIEPAG
ncbi:hypothetical protein CIT37_41940 [Bradyrhizobium ottawaense]|uniref:hypothetical protein n=1 Tax=Bradyrhizobium ottawaense TaxID=931866 RepID=UPI00126029AE|nr:hypothetical protein [Bradyrhizobium ottawaense]